MAGSQYRYLFSPLRIGPLALPYYFVLANAASLMGTLKFLLGGNHVVWTPIRETGAAVRQASLGKLQQPEAVNSPQ